MIKTDLVEGHGVKKIERTSYVTVGKAGTKGGGGEAERLRQREERRRAEALSVAAAETIFRCLHRRCQSQSPLRVLGFGKLHVQVVNLRWRFSCLMAPYKSSMISC